MTEPKFCIGQHVAVCTRGLEVVIPVTTVTHVAWEYRTYGHNPKTGEEFHTNPGFAYRVVGSPWRFAESLLRPIDPDTEYAEASQEQSA